MKILIALLISLSSIAVYADALPGETLSLTPDRLKFTFQTFDGTIAYTCKHVIEHVEAQDWRVTCYEGAVVKREFSVHLWLTRYARPAEPRTSFELLYWITERPQPGQPAQAGGSTVWFHVKGVSEFLGLSISQSFDQDTAGLYLDIK